MPARSLMVLGTASHVGKSLLCAALCRIFAQCGYRVVPFKAQNMSLNSAATPEGLEIGRAQAMQAEAAGVAASVHMNPVLIKPSGTRSSQIVVRGKVWRQLTAGEYHVSRVTELMPVIQESYNLLAAANDLVVLEGAGSPAEINLRATDVVNMRMAAAADASCILVGDIDRGGVFAAILGTLELLEPEDRIRIRGFVINKFRGDVELLWPGIRTIEERTGIPCLGVMPYLRGLALEEEDSVGLTENRSRWSSDDTPHRPLRVAVIALPFVSNFTDFDALASERSIELRYCRTSRELDRADVIILPGTKQTMDDLQWLRASGLEAALQRHAAGGGITIGICGGMQMLGTEIIDLEGAETPGHSPGLSLLPIVTTMQREKITRMASGEVICTSLFGHDISSVAPIRVGGYEIHLGETRYLQGSQPFTRITRHPDPSDWIIDGCISPDTLTMGTYLHGLFNDDKFRHHFVALARKASRLSPAEHLSFREQERETQWNRLAQEVEQALDLDCICKWLGLPELSSTTRNAEVTL